MSKQIYFVVGVDLDTKTKFIDDGTLTARFENSCWDTETNTWTKEDGTDYLEALKILNDPHWEKE